MKEYKVICRWLPEELETTLNNLAAKGWELASAFSTQILPGEKEYQCVIIMEREKNQESSNKDTGNEISKLLRKMGK